MIAYFFYRIAYFFATVLPLGLAYRVAIALSYLKYYISPRDRKAVVGNLLRILPPEEHSRVNRYAQKVFINFGKYMIEFFRIKYLTKEDIGRRIFIRGIGHIQAGLERGKGVIVVTAHLGNWELGGVCMALLNYPFVAVALPHRHPRVNAFFNRQRERIGVTVVPSVGVALRKIFASLKDNKIVALLGDRVLSGTGQMMDFLGSRKLIPKGPAVLAVKTGAAIVPGFVLRDEQDRQVIEFLPPFPEGLTEDEYMSSCTQIIEKKIRENPTQWLMFREFWKE
ncbi:MAG: lysophospholipid acyltransferase family protein [Candidatus Omnitrophota bacterium]